jgi:hypothetical protein
VVTHPAYYSPDLAPSNFHLFPKLKEDLRAQNLSSDVEVEVALCHSFWNKQKDLLNTGKSVFQLEDIIWKSTNKG